MSSSPPGSPSGVHPGVGPGVTSPPRALQPGRDKEPLSLLGGPRRTGRAPSLPGDGPAPPGTQVPSVSLQRSPAAPAGDGAPSLHPALQFPERRGSPTPPPDAPQLPQKAHAPAGPAGSAARSASPPPRRLGATPAHPAEPRSRGPAPSRGLAAPSPPPGNHGPRRVGRRGAGECGAPGRALPPLPPSPPEAASEPAASGSAAVFPPPLPAAAPRPPPRPRSAPGCRRPQRPRAARRETGSPRGWWLPCAGKWGGGGPGLPLLRHRPPVGLPASPEAMPS